MVVHLLSPNFAVNAICNERSKGGQFVAGRTAGDRVNVKAVKQGN